MLTILAVARLIGRPLTIKKLKPGAQHLKKYPFQYLSCAACVKYGDPAKTGAPVLRRPRVAASNFTEDGTLSAWGDSFLQVFWPCPLSPRCPSLVQEE